MPSSSPLIPMCRRGSIIVLVLMTVALLAVLLARFVDQTGTEVIVSQRTSAQSLMRSEAYSALETTLAVLAEFNAVDGGLFAPQQGWGDPLRYAGIESPRGLVVEVGFSDETGKLSLPRASPEELRVLLENSGVAADQARAAAEAFFQHTPQGETAGTAPAIRSYEELAAIEGVRELIKDDLGRPTALWGRIQETVTLHHHSATNLNTASPETFRALGWTEAQIGALQDSRQARFRSNQLDSIEGLVVPSGPTAAAGLGTRIEVLRIHVAVHAGNLTYRLETVVAPRSSGRSGDGQQSRPPGDLGYPFQILEFNENPETIVADGEEA